MSESSSRSTRQTKASASVTYYFCASCNSKSSSGRSQPLCSACLAASGPAQPSAQDPPPSAAVEPPPAWALALCQTVSELSKASQTMASALSQLSSSAPAQASGASSSSRGRSHKRARLVSSRSSSGSPGAPLGTVASRSLSSTRSRSPGELSISGSDSSSPEDPGRSSMVDSLVSAVRDTFNISASPDPTSSGEVFFSQGAKHTRATFPPHKEFDALLDRGWKSPDKRFQVPKRIALLYPFPSDQVELWSAVPTVDPPVSRLSKSTILPLANAASIKDSTDRHVDFLAKSAFHAAGTSLLPTLASTWVAKAVSTWALQLKEGVLAGAQASELADLAQQLSDAGQYLCSASLDAAGCAAWASANIVAIRRSLWLREWRADNASKKSLTGLPFPGTRLFGKKLDEIISDATGGKSSLLPQQRPKRDFRRKPGSFRSFRTLPPSRSAPPASTQSRKPTFSKPRSSWQSRPNASRATFKSGGAKAPSS